MLNNFRISYASTVLLALAALLFANAAQAMKIRQFDKMAIPDQGGYIGLLVGGAEKVLKDAAQMEDAAKVEHLFTTILPGD